MASSNPLDLSAEELAVLVNARHKAIAVAATGVMAVVTSWSTWVGLAAGIIAIIAGIVVFQRSRDSTTLFHGKAAVCCCCSTPWAQLDACCSAIISAGAFAVVCVIVNVILLVTEFDLLSFSGIVSVLNAVACAALAAACAIATSSVRKLIRDVFLRIDADMLAIAPAGGVMVGVPMYPPPPMAPQPTVMSHHHQAAYYHTAPIPQGKAV
jgi:hypothetical protein